MGGMSTSCAPGYPHLTRVATRAEEYASGQTETGFLRHQIVLSPPDAAFQKAGGSHSISSGKKQAGSVVQWLERGWPQPQTDKKTGAGICGGTRLLKFALPSPQKSGTPSPVQNSFSAPPPHPPGASENLFPLSQTPGFLNPTHIRSTIFLETQSFLFPFVRICVYRFFERIAGDTLPLDNFV